MTLWGPSWKPAAREVCLQEFENEVGSAAAVATAKPSRAVQSDHALRTSPLAVSNWIHGDPSFLKVRELIEVVDPELSVTDRKLLDAMLAHATDSVVNVVASGRSQPGTILEGFKVRVTSYIERTQFRRGAPRSARTAKAST
jgi:hypothetical protein